MITKVVSLMSQKGGVGKSSLTNTVILDWCFKDLLRHKQMPKILLIDADAQASISKLRSRDIEICKLDMSGAAFTSLNSITQSAVKEIRAQFEALYSQLSWRYYHIFTVQNADEGASLRRAIQLIESGEYEYVFIDMPGSLYQQDTAELFACINYLIIPVCIGNYDIQSSLDFCKIVKSLRDDTMVRDIRWVFNKYELLKASRFDEIEREIHSSTGIPFFKTRVKLSTFFSSRAYNSMIPATYRMNLNTLETVATPRITNASELTDEVRKFINE
jgi:cellulose biosynthesis protein BcsQ